MDDLQDRLDQLFGYPAHVEAWEKQILPARLSPYYSSWLDSLMQTSDLLWFGCGRNVQCDPALYYPRIPTLEEVAKAAPPGRIIGFDCLPPQLCTMCGLRDVRGYDGVDPARMVELVRTSEGPAKASEVCGKPEIAGFSTLIKTWDLSAWRLACP